MKRMFAMMLALAMLAVSAAMAEGESTAESETTQTRVQESVQQGRGPGRRQGAGKENRRVPAGASTEEPGTGASSSTDGTASEETDATSQATTARGPQGKNTDCQTPTAEKRERPSGNAKNGARPGNRGRTSKAVKPSSAETEAQNPQSETAKETAETGASLLKAFETMAEGGVISQETLENIAAYLEKNTPEAAGVEDLLEELLHAGVITQADYDALSRAE